MSIPIEVSKLHDQHPINKKLLRKQLHCKYIYSFIYKLCTCSMLMYCGNFAKKKLFKDKIREVENCEVYFTYKNLGPQNRTIRAM